MIIPARVSLQNPTSTYNLRALPAATAPVIARLKHGDLIGLLPTNHRDPNWQRAEVGNLAGWIQLTPAITIQQLPPPDGGVPLTINSDTFAMSEYDAAGTIKLFQYLIKALEIKP